MGELRTIAILFLSQSAAVPTTGLVGHYRTKALGVSVLAVLIVIAVCYWRREFFLRKIRESVAFRVIVLISSPLMAVGLSAIASWEELFQRSTYEVTPTSQPDWHTLLWVAIWAAGSAMTIAASVLALAFKEGEELKSVQLEKSLENERVARASVERQRTLLADITTFVMGIVKKKRDRLLRLVGGDVSSEQFFAAINPSEQIVLLVKVMHEFFMPDHPEEEFVLRLGIFVRDENNTQQLKAIYCWDGDKDSKFEPRNPEHLQIDNPYGYQSAIVRCFHSTEGCIIVPNCLQNNVQNVDDHLMPVGHEKEAASVVTFKHMYRNTRNEPDAMIVMLVASKADYFKQEEKPEIRQFLGEILTRLELEWMISESVTKLSRPQQEAA